MSDPVFLSDLPDPLPEPGAALDLAGNEGRHAAVVRRIGVGETIIIADGKGRAVRGEVFAAGKHGLTITVADRLTAPASPLQITAVQALAKGDRGELAVEMMTEIGVSRIVPWQAHRSMLRWSGERGIKGVRRWRASAREAAKQSRRFRVPEVAEPARTGDVVELLGAADHGLVLHESAADPLAASDPVRPEASVVIVVGPEGGITDEELAQFVAAGAQPVLLGDGVLRTSTAGVVAIAQLHAMVSGGHRR